MSELISIASPLESGTLDDESNKIHRNYYISRAVSSFNAAAKEAVEIKTFNALGVSKEERLINKRALFVLKCRRSLYGRVRYF